MSERGQGDGVPDRKRRRRGRTKPGFTLPDSPEALERRAMLAANVLDVTKVLWSGKQVEAVKDEYVVRMPQTNARTAKSPLDYAHRTPVVQRGWSLQSLGSGFYKVTAPGVTQATITGWGRQQGVQSVNVNAVRKLSLTPNDPLYAATDNWAFPQIDAADAWDTGTGTSTTIVAVVDTGVDYEHDDLEDNMWRNPNEIPDNGIDDDNNGYIDDVFGIDANGGTGDPMDDNGHGTFCAGLIGAVGNNAEGMAGVNWSVQIMAVKIFDRNGNTSIAAEVRGINYIIDQKVRGQNVAAANLSYGGYQFVQQEFDALSQLAQTGVVIVAAAGNETNNNDVFPAYPASYVIPGLISVAASTRGDTLAGFSNFGVVSVDLAAPGLNVLSTRAALASPLDYPAYNGNADFSVSSGTSFAAPLVAGTAGLLRSLKSTASIEQVKSAILDGADRIAALNGRVVTGGRLNLKNSVDLILSTTGSLPVATFTTGQNLSFLEGNGGYAFVDVKVSLDRPPDPGKSAAVWYETRPGGSAVSGIDFVAQSGYLTFAGSEMEKSIRLRLIADRIPEAAEAFAIRLDDTRSRGVTIGQAQANIVILDDDFDTTPSEPGPTNPSPLPTVSVDLKRQPDPNNPGETIPVPIREGGLATFVIALDRTSNKSVAVKYRTNQPAFVPAGTALAGVDYVATSGTMTFRPGELTKEFTVRILADKVNDPNETFHVVLTEPVNAQLAGAAGGAGSAGSSITATIGDVTQLPPPASGFQITLSFPDSSLTTSQQQVFQQAAARWSQIIVGDLPNVTDPATGQIVDDVLIEATAPVIDGTDGVLGQAGWTERRTGPRGLPWKGVMEFDSADVAALEASGELDEVILHEMAHVLGFGTLWTQFNLVQFASLTNPIYVGTNALREYRTIFGLPSATSVPVENTGAQGTFGSHWRESVFDNELMTGYLNSGRPNPISRITVGAFQDLGYQVNYARADAYTKPALRAGVGNGSTTPPRSNVRGQLLVAAPPVKTPQPRAAAVQPLPAFVAERVQPLVAKLGAGKSAAFSSLAAVATGALPSVAARSLVRGLNS